MFWFLLLLAAIIGGVCFRLKGDSIVADMLRLSSATTIGRLIWAVPVGVLVGMAHQPFDWLLPVVMIGALFLGTVFPHFGTIDMGTNDGTPLRDMGIMAARGLLYTVPAGAVLYYFGGGWGVGIVGALAGPLYWASWHWLPKGPAPVLDQPTEMAEVLCGVVFAAALIAAA